MKILIINYFYPPDDNAHVYRWNQIAKYWVEKGHKVEVFTGGVRGALNKSTESGVQVSRVGVVKRPIQNTSLMLAHDNAKSLNVLNFILNFIRPFYRKIYWPDAMWHWMPSILYKIIKSRHEQYDLIVSYYPCMSAHLAVAALRRFSKYPNFEWIADYGDPFSTSPTMQPNNYAVYDRLNKWTERSLSRSANCMVFTNEATANAYSAVLGSQEKIKVIPHLVNINQLYSAELRSGCDAGAPVVLYYIGGFHKNIREPDRLFNLIRGLNKDEGKYLLKIYGPLNGFSPAELAPADCPEIVYLGPIERDKAIEILKTADAILNVDNENCIMTPSKVVDCISTGRPIVNITNKGAAYQPLQAYEKSGYVISVLDEEISDGNVIAVKSFLAKHRQAESAPLIVVQEALKNHALETVANQYLELGMREKLNF